MAMMATITCSCATSSLLAVAAVVVGALTVCVEPFSFSHDVSARRTTTTMSHHPRLVAFSTSLNLVDNTAFDGLDEFVQDDRQRESALPIGATTSRRETLQSLIVQSVATVSFLPIFAALPPTASAAAADTSTADAKPSMVPTMEVLKRLRKVPVYAIVDGAGIPFMTYDSASAGANGYFFLDHTNAQGVLQDARKAYQDAKEKGVEGVSDTWGDSRIVTLPLDLAMRLTVKQISNTAQNDKSFRTIYQVLPSADDLETALRLENSMRYKQRGRVPLFYVDGFTLPDGTSTPAYFSTKDLRIAWNAANNPDGQTPLLNSRIQVRELSESFRAMIKQGGTDESVRNLVFVPSADSVKVADQMRQKQTGEVYKIGKIVLTK